MACPSTWEDVAPRKPRLNEVNANLTCMLCRGYLVDATTIVECLHSFCRSCIIQHLNVKCYCPICEMMINIAKPNIKPDKALQDIVYKMVPGLFEREMERRRAFYESRPEAAALASPEQRGEDMERLIFSPDDKISLSLELIVGNELETLSSCSSDSGTDSLTSSSPTNCGKRYLECPAKVKISHLKKFLIHKYDIDTTRHNVNVLYKRVPLPDFYTLMDIAYIYTWKRNEPMRFFYSFIENVRTIEDFEIFKSTEVKQTKTKLSLASKPNVKEEDVDLNNCETGPVTQITEHFIEEAKSKVEYSSFEKCIQNDDSVLNNDVDMDMSFTNASENLKTNSSSVQNVNEESDLEKSQFLECIQLKAKNSCSPQKCNTDGVSVDAKLAQSHQKTDRKVESNSKTAINISPRKSDTVSNTNIKLSSTSPKKSDANGSKSKSPQKSEKYMNEAKCKPTASPPKKTINSDKKIVNSGSITTSSVSKKSTNNDTNTNSCPTLLQPGKAHGDSKVNPARTTSPQKLDKVKNETKPNISPKKIISNASNTKCGTNSVSPQKVNNSSKPNITTNSLSKIIDQAKSDTKLNIVQNTEKILKLSSELKNNPPKSDVVNSSEYKQNNVVKFQTELKNDKSVPELKTNSPINSNLQEKLKTKLSDNVQEKTTETSDKSKILTDQNKQSAKADVVRGEIKSPLKEGPEVKSDNKPNVVCSSPSTLLTAVNKQSLKKMTNEQMVNRLLQECLSSGEAQSQMQSALNLFDSQTAKNGKRKTYTAKVNTKKRKLSNDQQSPECKLKASKISDFNNKAKIMPNLNNPNLQMSLNKNLSKMNMPIKSAFPDAPAMKAALSHQNSNKKLSKITESLKQNLSHKHQAAPALKEGNKDVSLEFGTKTLKSLIDSGCFNLPPSLSISLTESKDPVTVLNRSASLNETTLTEIIPETTKKSDSKKRSSPVNNYIEILKLPDANPSNSDGNSSTNKSESEQKDPGPVPNLKPIEAKVPKTSANPPQTFQQTFLQSLQQLEAARFLAKSKVCVKSEAESPAAAAPAAVAAAVPAVSTPKTSVGKVAKRVKNDIALDLSPAGGQSKTTPENGQLVPIKPRGPSSHASLALQIPSLFNRPRPSPAASQLYKQAASAGLSLAAPHVSAALTQQALLYQQLKINQLEIMASQSTFGTAAMVHFVKTLQAQNKTSQSTSKTPQHGPNTYPPKTKP